MWPSIVTIDRFLSKDDLDAIQAGIDAARFLDGGVTAGAGNVEVKHNQEMAPEQQYVAIVKMMEQAIKNNVELGYSVFPRKITRAIINRYDVGMSYGMHIDSPVIGFMTQAQAYGPYGQNFLRTDFSMTVFLTDPEDYEGGELTFGSPWGSQAYKLPRGDAVVYPTGIHHEVTKVTKGTRLAAVLWLQSMIRDHEHRRLISNMNRLADQLAERLPGSPEAELARDIAADSLRLAADV